MSVRILNGDCRQLLQTLPDQSVHCVITSPPYFGLRDYGHGDQIGLEATPTEFIATMVTVFDEVWRVLRDDGTLWLNLGDSYAGSWGAQGQINAKNPTRQRQIKNAPRKTTGAGTIRESHLKPKDMMGIPWRVAFALQANGWYLRQDIVWAKPNPMPESVRDRCTKSHEFLFLLTKSEHYYFDAESIAEDVVKTGTPAHLAAGKGLYQNERHSPQYLSRPSAGKDDLSPDRKRNGADGTAASFRHISPKRNKRDVWTVAVRPFQDAHFATFPPELIEPCVLAGTSAHGVCRQCGAGWERVVDRELVPTAKAVTTAVVDARDAGADANDQGSNRQKDGHRNGMAYATETTGWSPTCACGDASVVAATILDPFGGAGTTGLVADRHKRDAILMELNPEYAALAQRRLTGDAPLFADVS